MFSTPRSPEPDADGAFPSAWELAQLEALAEFGLGLARSQLSLAQTQEAIAQESLKAARAAASGEGVAPAPAARPCPVALLDPGALALAHARIARAVRQAVALHALIESGELARVLEGRRAQVKTEARAAAAAEPNARSADRETLASTPERPDWTPEPPARPSRERLFNDLKNPLPDVDLDALADRPLDASVALICQDLGIAFDPELWAKEQWTLQPEPPPRAQTLWAPAPSAPPPEPRRPSPAPILAGLAPAPAAPNRRAALMGGSGVALLSRPRPSG
jgi:hypothetical protein